MAAEGIERGLVHAGEAAQAAVGAYGGELVATTGNDFVGIGLVAHVPDEFIVGGVEDVVQGQGQLDGAKAGGQMSGMGGKGVDDVVAQLDAQLPKVLNREATKVLHGVDVVKYHTGGGKGRSMVGNGGMHNG